MDAARRSESAQGLRRLLKDCEAVERLATGDPASARNRLESALGSELARRLVGALTGGARGRTALV